MGLPVHSALLGPALIITCAWPAPTACDALEQASHTIALMTQPATIYKAYQLAGKIASYNTFLRSSGIDVIAHVQPCNPAVGGPAKSQLVHEVDALGGIIGKMADRCYLQKRVLNRSKVSPPFATWELPCSVWLPSYASHLWLLPGVRAPSIGAVWP